MSQKNDQKKAQKHQKNMEVAIRGAIARSQERIDLCRDLLATLDALNEDTAAAATALLNAQLNHAALLAQVLGIKLAEEPETPVEPV